MNLRIGRPATDQSLIDPRPQDIPRHKRSACVYCRRHRKAVLLAVVTNRGRLIVEDDDLKWVNPPHAVVVVCPLCPLGTSARWLSTPKLKARLRAQSRRDVSLDDVLYDRPVAI